jgi:hypothetical protein
MAYHKMVFRYDDPIRQGLETIKDRDGMPFHEQVRRAVLMWMAAKGVELVATALSEADQSRAARIVRLAHQEAEQMISQAYAAERDE